MNFIKLKTLQIQRSEGFSSNGPHLWTVIFLENVPNIPHIGGLLRYHDTIFEIAHAHDSVSEHLRCCVWGINA